MGPWSHSNNPYLQEHSYGLDDVSQTTTYAHTATCEAPHRTKPRSFCATVPSTRVRRRDQDALDLCHCPAHTQVCHLQAHWLQWTQYTRHTLCTSCQSTTPKPQQPSGCAPRISSSNTDSPAHVAHSRSEPKPRNARRAPQRVDPTNASMASSPRTASHVPRPMTSRGTRRTQQRCAVQRAV